MIKQNFIDLALYFVVYCTKEDNEVIQYIMVKEELEQETLWEKVSASLESFGCQEIKEIIPWDFVQMKTSKCSLKQPDQSMSKKNILMINDDDSLSYKSAYTVVFKGKDEKVFTRIVALPKFIVTMEAIIAEVKDMYKNYVDTVISVSELK